MPVADFKGASNDGVSVGIKQGYLWRRQKGMGNMKTWARRYYWIQLPEGIVCN
jgi:hypothetical protein